MDVSKDCVEDRERHEHGKPDPPQPLAGVPAAQDMRTDAAEDGAKATEVPL